MYLIGLNGKKGVGKDTAFEVIESWARQKGMLATRQGFADKLKLSAYRCFKPNAELEEALAWCDMVKQPEVGVEVHQWDRPYKPYADIDTELFDEMSVQEEISGRQFLQHYGTEAHREVFGDNFWVDQVLPLGQVDPVLPKWWTKFDPDTMFACITDVRFPNEAYRVQELQGIVIEIVRPDTDPGDGHASETPLPRDLVNQTIHNTGSLELFKSTVRTVIEERYGFVTGEPNSIKVTGGLPFDLEGTP